VSEVRNHLDEVAEHLREAESALGKARTALGAAMHADSFDDQSDSIRIEAARDVAGWHLGYRSWADKIIRAYKDPKQALADLKAEREQY